MPPKRVSKSRTGYFGVREKPSGNFGAEFLRDGYRYWLDTFKYLEVAAPLSRFVREHPEYFQAKQDFHWKRDAEQKKNKAVKKEDKAGPSTVIPIESDSSGWDDSEEEFETLDDSDDSIKEEFWERLENDITVLCFM
ncbi:uncharacterized protein [Aegilops tauschii subsp. strangulata]|uniref:uncharacterized protein n=1 Tax=Aegilops tauschii subsp. strangulata TaxID=200361 RepID=UPI003CC88420